MDKTTEIEQVQIRPNHSCEPHGIVGAAEAKEGDAMIPALPIEVYPANTLEGMIVRELVSMICECEDHTINWEPLTEVISKIRSMMKDARWPCTYQHDFLVRLRRDLTELTHGHPVTRQFVQLLEIETEFN